ILVSTGMPPLAAGANPRRLVCGPSKSASPSRYPASLGLRPSLVGATTYRRVICPDDRIPTDEPIDGQRALVHELSFARQTLETWRLDYNAVARRRRGLHRGGPSRGRPRLGCPSGYPPICKLSIWLPTHLQAV